MEINRRDLLFAGGLSLLAGAVPVRAQSQNSGSASARLLEALHKNRLPLTVSDGPAGRGWDWLVKEARDARFTLIGEEHGVAETVLPGPGSHQAVPGAGRSFVSISSDEFDEFQAGDQRLTRVLPNPNATGHEVIDLRALRPLAMRGLDAWNPDVVRTIHGYDAAVIWKAARASSS